MVHAVSAAYIRFDRMSPPAAGMAALLHLSIALALWWVSPLKFTPAEPPTIEVTMEQPSAPPQAEPAPAPPPPSPAPEQPQTPPQAATPPPPTSTTPCAPP